MQNTHYIKYIYIFYFLYTVFGWGLYTSGCSLLYYTWRFKMPETKVTLFFLLCCPHGKNTRLKSRSMGSWWCLTSSVVLARTIWLSTCSELTELVDVFGCFLYYQRTYLNHLQTKTTRYSKGALSKCSDSVCNCLLLTRNIRMRCS